MNPYDFPGSSSRSFERLIHALRVKRLGSRVTVFGDGPDGGPGATLDGALAYPFPEKWKPRSRLNASLGSSHEMSAQSGVATTLSRGSQGRARSDLSRSGLPP